MRKQWTEKESQGKQEDEKWRRENKGKKDLRNVGKKKIVNMK